MEAVGQRGNDGSHRRRIGCDRNYGVQGSGISSGVVIDSKRHRKRGLRGHHPKELQSYLLHLCGHWTSCLPSGVRSVEVILRREAWFRNHPPRGGGGERDSAHDLNGQHTSSLWVSVQRVMEPQDTAIRCQKERLTYFYICQCWAAVVCSMRDRHRVSGIWMSGGQCVPRSLPRGAFCTEAFSNWFAVFVHVPHSHYSVPTSSFPPHSISVQEWPGKKGNSHQCQMPWKAGSRGITVLSRLDFGISSTSETACSSQVAAFDGNGASFVFRP